MYSKHTAEGDMRFNIDLIQLDMSSAHADTNI